MINRKKFKIFNKITLLTFAILFTFVLMNKVFSVFYSDSTGVIGSKIAFYVVDAVPQTQQIKIGEIQPDGQTFRYSVDVSNFKNGKTSEIDMDYTLQVVTTTNIPVTFALYKGNDNTNIIGTKEVITDSNGMYFFKYNPQVGSFVHGVQKTDTFTLEIVFPVTYNSAEYQDLIETIEITVDVNQA